MYGSVLVATDGSEHASLAVAQAIELAGTFDVPLYGLAVVETRTAYDNEIVDPAVVDRQLRERARASLESLEERAAANDVVVETAIRSGVPYEEILAFADERNAGVIVIGSQGRSSFRRALLGSTVDGVVRFSDRPVLVVDGSDGSSPT